MIYTIAGWNVQYVHEVVKLTSPEGNTTEIVGGLVVSDLKGSGVGLEFSAFVRAVGETLPHILAVEDPAEFEIYDGDEYCAAVSGPRPTALQEIAFYAARCQDPQIYEIKRQKVVL